jgi:putative ABC transport system ATP-binding protein
MAILSLQSVSKEYSTDGQSVRALENVSLEVVEGEFVTLLHLAGAMDFPTSGTVCIEGRATSGLNDAQQTALRREKVGFIFQSFQLLHTLTIQENVELPLLLAGKPGARETAVERLHWVELDGLGARYPHQLSGGQMQRVAIARALAHSPRILLADEPTGNLDTTTSTVILDLLLRLTRERKTATILATHSQEAAGAADTLVSLRDGRIAEITRR